VGATTLQIDRSTLVTGVTTFAAVRTADCVVPDEVETQMNSPTERVVGIGGLFFRSREPQQLAQWYQLYLGIEPVPTDYGQRVWQQTAGPTAFSPFAMDTDSFRSRQQAWMVNFRVRRRLPQACQTALAAELLNRFVAGLFGPGSRVLRPFA